jgi:enamine deaminase RidA (YjgF/YER057c/UK114 family)
MRSLGRAGVIAVLFVLVFAGGVVASTSLAPGWDFSKFPPRPASPPARSDQAIHNIDTAVADPFIASGVSLGDDVELYYTSGIGPGALNAAAPAGTPERYVDPAQFPGGALSAGATITEAQGMNVLARIQENLATVGLTMRDVITLRVFMDNAPGAPTMDFAGFNRAYRQFFANVNLHTGAVIPQRVGTAEPAPPLVVNPVRPSRTALEVAGLPVAGWLVEIEAVAKRSSQRHRHDD